MDYLVYWLAAVFFFVASAVFLWHTLKTLHTEKERAAAIDPVYAPVVESEERFQSLSSKYEAMKQKYQQNLARLRTAEEKLSFYELGIGTTDQALYEVKSEASSLQSLEKKLKKVKEQAKELVRKKKACECELGKNVRVNNRRASATKLINREIRLRIRCLDNEFKMANAIVDWNNINRLIRRCELAFEEINNEGKAIKTFLRKPYLDLKIQELKLNFEVKALKARIKDEEREQKAIEREARQSEERLKRDTERARKEREKMERLVAKELAAIEAASSEQRELIELHKRQLQALKERESRAVSMAQLTRAGFVYVISNEMSFGKGVCKIGMTRRLDPNVRVKELGDASVPELFDVHAFAYSEDAPALEAYLHKKFDKERVNLVNRRKEFFNVEPATVIDALKRYKGDVDLRTDFDAVLSGTSDA